MNGNFKAKCVKPLSGFTTVGKVYQVTDGRFRYDSGAIAVGIFNSVGEMNEQCISKFELVKDALSITATCHSKKVVGTISDGEHKYSQYVKLSDANGDYDTAVKMLVDRLIEKFKPAEVKTNAFDWSAFKSGKFAVHCDTEEKAKAFLGECDEQGIKWCTGARPLVEQKETRWNVYKEKTSYGFACDGLQYGTYDEKTKIDYQPTIPSVREVHRPAKVGEWIKVTKSIFSPNPYKVGEIYKVFDIDDHGYICIHAKTDPRYDDIYSFTTKSDEYVVLENYQPPKSEPKPFVKAKVGDKIKIVNATNIHCPAVKVGDMFTVANTNCRSVDNDHNVFYDEDEEYIIIEEAPEKPKTFADYSTDELLTEIKRRADK